jgi:hypothetical protein
MGSLEGFWRSGKVGDKELGPINALREGIIGDQFDRPSLINIASNQVENQ